ncbi:MAG: DinB family protein [Bacteroidetes bacterium]|nr:DinB family protein [Bacteroidota bacterium]MBU1371187.1 DinB family protein [Bacteroidota bacterium]MBU1483764.1 DinB family protein [Bacteroidota bacterium]MBU1762089.1 DinB family protein [Bacteroidota bacterium]MBU2046610.1 DinB family protein [Bacteroidota bacterium]
MESITKLLLEELEREASTTRKMLSIVPNAQYGWKPHEKSMDLKALATHIADIPSWIELILISDELDFMNSTHQIDDVNNTIELVSFFDRSVEKSTKALSEAKDDILDLIWTMRSGETIYTEATKYESIRMSFGQLIHHRAQLGVYLRLLNIPIPGSYGPSADDHSF